MTKTILAIVDCAFIANAESPVKIKIELDKEAGIEILKDVWHWTKAKAIELAPVVKEKALEGAEKAKEATEEFLEEAKKESEENIKAEVVTPKKEGIRI